jgi:hypothetical protein
VEVTAKQVQGEQPELDIFDTFDAMVKDRLAPWLRNQGFKGRGRNFHRELSSDELLLLTIKRDKYNRRDSEDFRFVIVAYLRHESGWLTWFWDSAQYGARPRPDDRHSSWESLGPGSDVAALAQHLEHSISTILLPAAQHEVDHSDGPPLSGARVGKAEEMEAEVTLRAEARAAEEEARWKAYYAEYPPNPESE